MVCQLLPSDEGDEGYHPKDGTLGFKCISIITFNFNVSPPGIDSLVANSYVKFVSAEKKSVKKTLF